MEQVKASDYDEIISLIRNMKFCPTFAYTVVEQIIPGIVYVDDKRMPSTVLIGTFTGIYFVAGDDTNPTFNQSLRDLYHSRQKEGVSRFTLFSESDDWDGVIREIFQDEMKQLSRYSFSFNPTLCTNDSLEYSKDSTLKRIDEGIIKKSTEFHTTYYEEYWGSVSNFLANGFGYAVVHNNKVVSECSSIFSGTTVAEIDISTRKEYRGMGLASIAAQAFINHCLKNSITPSWDCDIENIASIKLAEKLGFEKPRKYSIFFKKYE